LSFIWDLLFDIWDSGLAGLGVEIDSFESQIYPDEDFSTIFIQFD